MKRNKSARKAENIEKSQQPFLKNGGDFFDAVPVPVMTIDNNYLIKTLNNAAFILFGSSIINSSFPGLIKLKNINDEDISITEIFNKKDFIRHEVLFEKDRNSLRFVMTAATIKDNNKNTSGYTIALTDITEQLNEFDNLNIELKGKTILLKEIHHRIKNNLQIINSILTLQMYYVKNEELTVLLTGLQARIRTIALIHEKLYQTENPKEINICNFMKDLLNILFQVYELNTEFTKFSFDIDEIVLETDIVLQLGLIINELITNSVKYAFPSGKGEIFVSFKVIGDKYEMHFKDNGVGMPQDFLSHKVETLGSQLLESLIEQLNGTVEIKTNHGTEFIITFPHSSI